MTAVNEKIAERRAANERVRSLNWKLFFFYFLVVVRAVYGEMWTLYALATFGYYYIMIGMPGWLVCWLALLIHNEISPVEKAWLWASIAVGLLAVIGYMNINP